MGWMEPSELNPVMSCCSMFAISVGEPHGVTIILIKYIV